MKIFKLSEVESVTLKKWGSIENLEAEREKRKQKNCDVESRIEEEKRHFWDRGEIFEPLKQFMENIELPAERVSSYFKEKTDDVQGELHCQGTRDNNHQSKFKKRNKSQEQKHQKLAAAQFLPFCQFQYVLDCVCVGGGGGGGGREGVVKVKLLSPASGWQS